jgi:hypothetical protein
MNTESSVDAILEQQDAHDYQIPEENVSMKLQ